MSLSSSCIAQHDREAARAKTILLWTVLGSVGLHGLAWGLSALWPSRIAAEEVAVIELFVTETEAEAIAEEAEEQLQNVEPEAVLNPVLSQLETSTPEITNPAEPILPSSDFLKTAARFAPAPPAPVLPVPALPAPALTQPIPSMPTERKPEETASQESKAQENPPSTPDTTPSDTALADTTPPEPSDIENSTSDVEPTASEVEITDAPDEMAIEAAESVAEALKPDIEDALVSQETAQEPILDAVATEEQDFAVKEPRMEEAIADTSEPAVPIDELGKPKQEAVVEAEASEARVEAIATPPLQAAETTETERESSQDLPKESANLEAASSRPSVLASIQDLMRRARTQRPSASSPAATEASTAAQRPSSMPANHASQAPATVSTPSANTAAAQQRSPSNRSTAITKPPSRTKAPGSRDMQTSNPSSSTPSTRGPETVAVRTEQSTENGTSSHPRRQTITCRRCPKPKFTADELRQVEGKVKFDVVTDDRGRVVDVIVTQSSGSPQVDAKAIRHIKRRFRLEGVSGGATVPVTFDLAVEGSNYHRQRQAGGQRDRLEAELPTPSATPTLPTATTPVAEERVPATNSRQAPIHTEPAEATPPQTNQPAETAPSIPAPLPEVVQEPSVLDTAPQADVQNDSHESPSPAEVPIEQPEQDRPSLFPKEPELSAEPADEATETAETEESHAPSFTPLQSDPTAEPWPPASPTPPLGAPEFVEQSESVQESHFESESPEAQAVSNSDDEAEPADAIIE